MQMILIHNHFLTSMTVICNKEASTILLRPPADPLMF